MNGIHDISQAEFERIEKYITRKLSAEEKADFEKELAENPRVKAGFDEISVLLEGIERAALKETLEEFQRNIGGNDKSSAWKKIFFNRKFYLAAASVFLAVLITALFLGRPDENQRLFAGYFKSDPGLVTAMSGNDLNYEFERGMVDFKTENYQASIERWEPLLAEKPTNDTLNYFLGVAYLELEKPGPAIARLETATITPESKFKNEAYWYLALAYILDDRKNEATEALENTNHPEKTELLNKLHRK